MKPADFAYARPDSVAEAVALLADPDREAMPIAGGQSLLPMMNFRLARPDLLVDLARIDALRGVCRDGDGLVIGAMTRYADLARDPQIAEHLPLVAKALTHVAHPAIRNRGTLGGSLALADPAAELPAVALALGAEIRLQGPAGARTIAADDFFLGLYETARAENELIVAVRFPIRPGQLTALHEVARRAGDYAMAGVAVTADACAPYRNLRIAFFGIADRPVRDAATEAALEGTDGPVPEIALDVTPDLNASAPMKHHLARTVLTRALAELA